MSTQISNARVDVTSVAEAPADGQTTSDGAAAAAAQGVARVPLRSTQSHVAAMARLGTALSETVRVATLLELRSGRMCSSDLAEAVGVTRQVMSNHLSALKESGLVVGSRQGRQMYYELASPHLSHALEELLTATLAIEPGCCDGVHRHRDGVFACSCMGGITGEACDE